MASGVSNCRLPITGCATYLPILSSTLLQIKQDVLNMMVQYLRNEKLFMSAVVIQDEANMKAAEQQVPSAVAKACHASFMALIERREVYRRIWLVKVTTDSSSTRHHI